MLKLIVGLGNPGAEYAATRHNAGFWWIDQLAKQLGVEFNLESKFSGYLAQITMASGKIWLLKPQTYMNLSGKSVHSLANFYKISPEQILVAHDELDFAPGVAKLKCGGGNGGHNGLKDIDRVIGSKYWRLRIGIGHPGLAAKVPSYVLQRPSVAEQVAIEQSISHALKVSTQLLAADFATAQKQLHSKE